MYLRPEFAGVSPPVTGVEDEDVSTERPLQHRRQLVQHERLGPVVFCFELYEEGAPEELHGAIIILLFFLEIRNLGGVRTKGFNCHFRYQLIVNQKEK